MKLRGGKKRVDFKPYFEKYERKPLKGTEDVYWGYWDRRSVACKKNTGSYYAQVAEALFGGRVLHNGEPHNNETPLHGVPKNAAKNFRPDILIKQGSREIQGEVKASSTHVGHYAFGASQITNMGRSFLENPYAEPYLAMFKYGDSREKKRLGKTKGRNVRKGEMLHKIGPGGLIKKLSESTRGLTIVPHNLMTFLASVASRNMHNHASSNTARNEEHYFNILGGHITRLQKYWENPMEAVEQILAEKKGRLDRGMRKIAVLDNDSNPLPGFKIEDFMLDGLHAEQVQSPTNIFCTGYHHKTESGKRKDVEFKTPVKMTGYGKGAKSFPITIYRMAPGKTDEWREHFGRNLEYFLGGLGLKEVWDRQQLYLDNVAASNGHVEVRSDEGVALPF
jgi:hypothetical protein